LILGFVVALAFVASTASSHVESGPQYYLYLSPTGNDGNEGTFEAPIRSFQRAEEMLDAALPECDVVVRLISDRGVFVNYSVHWSYSNPEYSIVFESYPDDLPAIFRADADDPTSEPFFTLDASRGEPTNLVFKRIVVEDYVSRVFYFLGDRENRDGGWNGRNILSGCTFRNIGNSRLPSLPIVYGAITFVNSRDNVIDGCTFVDFANANTLVSETDAGSFPEISLELQQMKAGDAVQSSTALPIVGVYFANGSSRNAISNCTMERIIGDPIRIRDDSDSTMIDNCVFTCAGHNAVCSIWYCEGSFLDCDKIHPECPSCFAVMRDCRAFGDRYCKVPKLVLDLNPILSRRCPIGCRIADRIRIENTTAQPCLP
jgi:hypothetical protein